MLKRFARAVSAVTIIPLAPLQAHEDETEVLSGLSKYLPAVGLLIGGILWGLAYLLSLIHANGLISAAILTVAWLVVTGGLHMDGLMDTADGIFSHRSPERMLEIMTDSRVGNFGALSGVCLLLLKFVGLCSVSCMALSAVLVLTPALARLMEVYAIGCFPYLRTQGRGKVWHDSTHCPGDLLRAALLPAAAIVAFVASGNWIASLLCLVSVLCGAIASHWISLRLGGHTGDTYGAVVELVETFSIVIVALLYPQLMQLVRI